MLFFKKKNNKTLDLSWLGTDMHSHLVPGIDDGSPDVAASLQLIEGLMDLGYKKIITTPHILWEIYPNTPEKIANGLQEVQQAASNQGIDVHLHAAAEYFIDERFQNELLVEFSMMNAPLDLMETLFEMQMQGYQPVIAHPERYIYLTRNKEFFTQLKDAGYLFQLNLLSLTGYYGTAIKDLAEYLIKQEYYDLAGTDLHGAKHLEALQKLASLSSLQKLKDSGRLKNHLL
jgi:protein-tyrosine phosphatase